MELLLGLAFRVDFAETVGPLPIGEAWVRGGTGAGLVTAAKDVGR